MAKAVGRVLARHAMTRAAGFELPFDQFAREVTGEVVWALERRAAKDARRNQTVTAMAAALTSVVTPVERGFVDLDPAEFAVMLTAGVRRLGPDPESN